MDNAEQIQKRLDEICEEYNITPKFTVDELMFLQKHNPIHGSLFYMRLIARLYRDILDIEKAETPGKIVFICKEDYNIDEIYHFVENHVPININYTIKVKK